LENHHTEARVRRFFLYWTLKEAYVKARGLGLAFPLQQFSFLQLESPEPIITFSPPFVDDSRGWQFFAVDDLSPEHQIAVGVRAAPQGKYKLITHYCVPGSNRSTFRVEPAP